MARELNEREKQLLMSARAQLSAITDGLPPIEWNTEFYQDILQLMGEIERLLGY